MVRSWCVGVAAFATACGSVSANKPDAQVDSTSQPDMAMQQTVYSDVTDKTKWEKFDVGIAFGAGANTFGSVLFDDHYVYYASAGDGTILRYDTAVSFGSRNSWVTFDATTKDANAKVFRGTYKIGSHLYFVPQEYAVALRYDTTMAFSDAAAWETFSLANVIGAGGVYYGGATDGRTLYLVPYATPGHAAPSGAVLTYDSQKPFAMDSSWASYNLGTAIGVNARGFTGAGFDGRMLYLVPYAAAVDEGVIVAHDTQSGLTSAWTPYDLAANVDAGAKGYAGAVFAGGALYLSPYNYASTATHNSLAVRYDTTKAFDQKSSWTAFDVSTVNPSANGFFGGEFDGRYVYFTAHYASLARYDTTMSFTATASWQAFDTSEVDAKAKDFDAATFDGRYLYLAPGGNGLAVRFDAKTPASIPTPKASFL
jgi:hypothetical protein